MPANNRAGSYRTCCGQSLCAKCDAGVVFGGPDVCPYCRAPGAKTGAETFARLKALIDKNPENKKALSHLGDSYKRGDGVKADINEARRLYERAVALGDAGAAVGLAEIYAQGLGVTADAAEARRYYELGIELGSVVAVHNLGIFLVMNGNETEAKTYFIRAAARGYADSVNSLTIMQRAQQGVNDAEVAAARRMCQRGANL